MTLMKTDTVQAATIEQVLINGDLSKLNSDQRNIYYKSVCDSLGLNPLTRPFEYIVLNGKLTLYARKDCTDQLRNLRGISIRIVGRENVEGVMIVTAQATDKHNRIDESTGAVSVQGLRGEALANAVMKSETKAKRRVTLSICGLGFTDESEVDSIPHARVMEPAAPRLADRLVESHRAVIHNVLAPTPKAEQPAIPPAAPPTPPETPAASGTARVMIESIEEHKGKSGPIWKIVVDSGEVYACSIGSVVSDLNEARREDSPMLIEWQRRGARNLILSAEIVAT